MSLTLVEAAKLSNNVLLTGVVEKIVYQDPLMERLKFIDCPGNGITYNVEATPEIGASFYNVGDTWVESTATFDQHTAKTTILGGDADVDKFLEVTRGNLQGQMAAQIALKTKAVINKFLKMLYYGYWNAGAGGDAKGFDGLHYLIRSQAATATPYMNTVCLAATSGTAMAFSMELGEKARDYIKVGSPDLVVMTKAMRRAINKYLKGVGGITSADIQGKTVQTFLEVPIAVSDILSDDEACDKDYGDGTYGHDYTDGTALANDDNATSMFFLQFADNAVLGLQSLKLTQEPPIQLEDKDAWRCRVKWYPGLMLQNILTCSKVSGISPTGTVSA